MSDEAQYIHMADVREAIRTAEQDRSTIGYALSHFATKQYYTFDEMRHWLTATADSTAALTPDAYLALAQAPLPESYSALHTTCEMTGANHTRVYMALDEARRYG